MVNKISFLNASVSAVLPVGDIPLTFFITETMLKLISTLSIHTDRSFTTYKAAHSTIVTVMTTLRTGALITAAFLTAFSPFTVGITLAVGTTVGFGTSFTVTEVVGRHAIKYFLQ